MGFENVKGKSTTLNDSVTSEGVGDFGKAQWAWGNSILLWDHRPRLES